MIAEHGRWGNTLPPRSCPTHQNQIVSVISIDLDRDGECAVRGGHRYCIVAITGIDGPKELEQSRTAWRQLKIDSCPGTTAQ